jgi:sulfite reductase alpha subunit-like flavoprotein
MKKYVKNSSLPSILSQVKFSIFGLGSSDYQEFGRFPFSIDTFLSNLGMQPLMKTVIADEKLGQKNIFTQWKNSIQAIIFEGVGAPVTLMEPISWQIQKSTKPLDAGTKQYCTFVSFMGNDRKRMLHFQTPTILDGLHPGDYIQIYPHNNEATVLAALRYFGVQDDKECI